MLVLLNWLQLLQVLQSVVSEGVVSLQAPELKAEDTKTQKSTYYWIHQYTVLLGEHLSEWGLEVPLIVCIYRLI